MTRMKTNTGKYNGPGKQAQIRMKDFANSFACALDPKMLALMDECMKGCLEQLFRMQEESPEGYAVLWTDGSYNRQASSAGIGVMVQVPGRKTDVFGKAVRAEGSSQAEIYAMAVGLSYFLDTYPEMKSVRLRYDCLAAGVSAANLDLCADRGAPYTNLRSAMKRARKAGVTVLFQQVKAHTGNARNETCDLVARYYAKAWLDQEQKRKIAPYILKGRGNTPARQKN